MSGEKERAERADKARSLREEGLSYRAIGKRLGVSHGQIQRDLAADKKESYAEQSRLEKRNLRPRMDAVESRLDDAETTITDLSDRLAALEAAADRPKAKGQAGPGPAAKRATADIQKRVRRRDREASRATRNRAADG